MQYLVFVISIILISFVLLLFIQKHKFFIKNFSTNDEFIIYKKEKKLKNIITGTGIVFLPIFLFSNLFFFYFDNNFFTPNRYFFFLLSLSVITIVSFFDDKKSIDPILRLLTQLLCVYVSIASIEIDNFPLPLKANILLGVCIWVYLINITNFIDGSDGFCAINVIFFYFGVLILNYFNIQLFSFYFACILLPTLFSFIFFNRPNAKIFMGDVGSIFLGFLVGFSFLEIAIKSNILISITIFIYPLMDCSFCLVKKVLKGYMPWKRLGDYFYLKVKKKILNKNRKAFSYKILKIIIIQNIFNLFILYFMLKLNNYFLFFLGVLSSGMAMIIYHNLQNKN